MGERDPGAAMLAVLSAVEAEYAEPEVRVTAVPGQVTTQDWCWGDCAMVFVRLDSAYPSSAFPDADRSARSCTSPLAARFHVGVARCIHGMDAQGNAPDPVEQTGDAALILGDAVRLQRAITCAIRDTFDARSTLLGAWTPMGPFGNCAGGYWPLTVRLL